MEQNIQEIDKQADKIVRDIGIPPCPAILTRLLKEMHEDEPDYNKASKPIGTEGIAEVPAQLTRPPGITNRDEIYPFALFRDRGIPLMIGKFPAIRIS